MKKLLTTIREWAIPFLAILPGIVIGGFISESKKAMSIGGIISFLIIFASVFCIKYAISEHKRKKERR